MAICEYLDELHPNPRLLPDPPEFRARIRGFCEVINSGMHPYQNLRLLEKVGSEFGADKMKFAKDWVLRGLDTLEALLAAAPSKYCCGDQLTLADAFFAPQVQGAVARFGADLGAYPHVQAVLENLREIPAFLKAEPKNQADF
jgi:maleylacetoacetate isomerase